MTKVNATFPKFYLCLLTLFGREKIEMSREKIEMRSREMEII